MSEEGHLHLNSFVNKNCEIWVLEKHRNIHPHALPPLQCTVTRPYIFEHPKVQKKPTNLFQQDSDIAHGGNDRASKSSFWLSDNFMKL